MTDLQRIRGFFHRVVTRLSMGLGLVAWGLACGGCDGKSASTAPAASATSEEPPSPEVRRLRLARRYDYLPNRKPLESAPEWESLPDGSRVARFTFRGQSRRLLPAVLALPVTPKAPSPLVVYLHRANETPDVAIEICRALGPSGPAVLAFTLGTQEHSTSANAKRELAVRDRLAALDTRFALDAASTFPEIDGKRIVVMGASQGAAAACIAGSVEPRISGVISIVGGGDVAAANRQLIQTSDPRAEAFSNALDLVDPREFLSLLGERPILFVQASRDSIPNEQVTSLIASAPARKTVVRLDEEHRFPFDRAAGPVREWLTREMGY